MFVIEFFILLFGYFLNCMRGRIFNMKKNLKTGIIILILLICIFILKIYVNKPTDEKVIHYIKNLGYVNEGNSSIYYNQISSLDLNEFNDKVANGIEAVYEKNYFYVDAYQLIKNKMEYSDNIIISFDPKYDYRSRKLTYTYRINTKNSSIIFEGSYNSNTEEFICENTYYYNFDIYKENGVVCDKILYDVKDFYYEVLDFITSAKLLDEMSKS